MPWAVGLKIIGVGRKNTVVSKECPRNPMVVSMENHGFWENMVVSKEGPTKPYGAPLAQI